MVRFLHVYPIVITLNAVLILALLSGEKKSVRIKGASIYHYIKLVLSVPSSLVQKFLIPEFLPECLCSHVS